MGTQKSVGTDGPIPYKLVHEKRVFCSRNRTWLSSAELTTTTSCDGTKREETQILTSFHGRMASVTGPGDWGSSKKPLEAWRRVPDLNEIPDAREMTLLAAVVDKEIRPKRNGGSYLALRLADPSAEFDLKVWDNPEAVAQLFSTSDVVKVRGVIEHYNDKPQLIVSRIRHL